MNTPNAILRINDHHATYERPHTNLHFPITLTGRTKWVEDAPSEAEKQHFEIILDGRLHWVCGYNIEFHGAAPSAPPVFDTLTNSEWPEASRSSVIILDDEGNEEDTIAFAPMRGHHQMVPKETNGVREQGSRAMAEFLALAVNAYITTREGREQWERAMKSDRAAFEACQPQSSPKK